VAVSIAMTDDGIGLYHEETGSGAALIFVHEYAGDVLEALSGADCAVVMVAHSAYRELDLQAAAATMRRAQMVDARALFKAETLKVAGFTVRTIGVGTAS